MGVAINPFSVHSDLILSVHSREVMLSFITIEALSDVVTHNTIVVAFNIAVYFLRLIHLLMRDENNE